MLPEQIKECLGTLRFTKHAKDEMLGEEFGEIASEEIREALENGEVVEKYPEDRPFPSFLVHGRTKNERHLHVVCAPLLEERVLVIITVYEPDPDQWIDYQRRK